MEVLLNLVWMLLALPAWWLWHERARRPAGNRPWQCLLALACLLILLFPVISASDDLNAMRADIEENGAGRSSSARAQEAGKENPAARFVQAALPSAGQSVAPVAWGRLNTMSAPLRIASAPRTVRSGRAPPLPLA